MNTQKSSPFAAASGEEEEEALLATPTNQSQIAADENEKGNSDSSFRRAPQEVLHRRRFVTAKRPQRGLPAAFSVPTETKSNISGQKNRVEPSDSFGQRKSQEGAAGRDDKHSNDLFDESDASSRSEPDSLPFGDCTESELAIFRLNLNNEEIHQYRRLEEYHPTVAFPRLHVSRKVEALEHEQELIRTEAEELNRRIYEAVYPDGLSVSEDIRTTKTLAEQLNLAKGLYDWVLHVDEPTPFMFPDEPGVSADSILCKLRNAPLDKELVTWQKGVSVDWLLSVFAKHPFIRALVEIDYGLWFIRKVCIVELLRRSGVESGAFVEHIEVVEWDQTGDFVGAAVSTPTIFLSYTGRFSFACLIRILESLRGEVIWMDVFCVDQFAWTGQSRNLGEFRKSLTDGLQKNIQNIGRTVLLCERWDLANYTLKQIWVLWEIYCTCEAKVPLRIMFGDDQAARFLEFLRTTDNATEDVQELLTAVDASTGQSEEDADRELILLRMAKVGFYNINVAVASKVREWLIKVSYLEILKDRASGGSSDDFTRTVARLLTDQGKTAAALQLHRDVLENKRKALDGDHPAVLEASIAVASLLPTDSDAEAHLKEAIFKFEHMTKFKLRFIVPSQLVQSQLPVSAPFMYVCEKQKAQRLRKEEMILRSAYSSLIGRLVGQEKFEEAEDMCRHELRLAQVLGFDDLIKAKVATNLAMVLRGRGHMAESYKYCCLAGNWYREKMGDHYHGTLVSMLELSFVLREAGKVDDAVDLVNAVWRLLRKVRGSEHPDTLQALATMIELILDAGDMTGAAYYCELLVSEPSWKSFGQGVRCKWPVETVLSFYRRWKEPELVWEQLAVSLNKTACSDTEHCALVASVRVASKYKDKGRQQEAERMFVDVLRKRRRNAREDDTLVKQVVNQLLEIYLEGSRPKDCIELLVTTLEMRKGSLGHRHPLTVDSMMFLANCYYDGDITQGIRLREEILVVREKEQGPNHRDTLVARNTLAVFLYKGGMVRKAESMFSTVIDAIREYINDSDLLAQVMGEQNYARSPRNGKQVA